MTQEIFWEIIESSWADSPNLYKKRADVLKNNDEEIIRELCIELENTILEYYQKRLLVLDKEAFTKYIHILEERLYNIDRQDIHEYTDGSDDGFLYSRCFVIGMGQQYYNMIDNNPSKATMDLDAELFGFSAYKVYEEKFGEEFERNSIYCIETCSNGKGWF
ncbi:DUF4240 domain-containing protein [Arcicella aquatica]|uniref:DUF4240 domain-containing protein n=1 Tax=Arcicella aquatica TaxID=217141 RepID=A0ABU5QLE1_9BACT|nr:DUF4240 domain-containing protein [Arcicella aquatica]MEA5257559.1 DUF4240 domain-containing protein [Arcicella aquatica]